MAMVVCMCLGVSSCTHRNREIEEIAQRELGYYKDFYVIALQTGRVKLPKGGQNPHVTHPGMGGVETPINQVWLVNGGRFGEVYECRGCDSCMTCYQKAGLIDYRVEATEQDSVIALVRLTDKGSRYLIENYLDDYYPILDAWRRRMSLEMVLVAKEMFDIDVQSTDTTDIYRCTAQRYLALTPFIESIGGTAKDKTKDYTYTFRLDCRDPKLPLLTNKEMLEP